MPRQIGPSVAPVPSVIPVKQYPWLKNVVKQLDYACPTCTSGQGQPVYRRFLESRLDPISGPAPKSGPVVTQEGIVATRFLVICPECNNQPQHGPFINGGIIDLLEVPHDYVRPPRPQGETGNGITYDDDVQDEAEVEEKRQPRKFGSGRQRKKSDLNPKTRQEKAIAAARASLKKVPKGLIEQVQRGQLEAPSIADVPVPKKTKKAK